jgi:hypothetical protein
MKSSDTRVTFDQLSEYMNNGAPLTQVREMIDMLRSYEYELESNITDWREYIPTVSDHVIWCDRASGWNPQVNLQIILTFLFQQGYQVRFPRIEKDGVSATWEVLKNGRISKLEYKHGIGYTINGIFIKLSALK